MAITLPINPVATTVTASSVPAVPRIQGSARRRAIWVLASLTSAGRRSASIDSTMHATVNRGNSKNSRGRPRTPNDPRQSICTSWS